MRAIIFLLACFSGIYPVHAQDSTKSFSKNTLFFEAFGNSILAGLINYDRIIINEERWKFDGRVGFSFVSANHPLRLGFPLEFSFLVGKKKHFFEAGIGVTYLYESDVGEKLSSFYLFSRLGYRYQKPQGGLFIKAGLNTVTPLNEDAPALYQFDQRIIWPFGGLGIGYTFKQKEK